MITVEKLTKSFGSHRVLDGVDHRQERSESVVILGPSGCGKSTFLRCLNQLEVPDSGRITIADVAVDCSRPVPREIQRQLRLRAGMVFQQFHLFPHLTALENILEAPVHVQGRPRAEVMEEARALLAQVGLSDRADHRPSQLSAGAFVHLSVHIQCSKQRVEGAGRGMHHKGVVEAFMVAVSGLAFDMFIFFVNLRGL